MNSVQCPICYENFGGGAEKHPSTIDGSVYECSVCGQFAIAGTAEVQYFSTSSVRLSHRDRAALAHLARLSWDRGEPIAITTATIKNIQANSMLPSPSVQLVRLLVALGGLIGETGLPAPIASSMAARVGAMDHDRMDMLIAEADARRWIKKNPGFYVSGGSGPTVSSETTYDLTVSGWDQYEKERRGLISGNYGFLALQFNDPVLDPIYRDTIRPSIKSQLGYDVVDMREISRPGVIDNIMREHLREAAFIIADLTHDNPGAYWEAGFAEGLGKPVVYICEENKFNSKKTHFDTNHCTTIKWDPENLEQFSDELVATLKRAVRPLTRN